MEENRTYSQIDKILGYVKAFGSITQREAIRFGCYRLASRINDIKRRGYIVKREMIEVTNADQTKTRVARYRIYEAEGK